MSIPHSKFLTATISPPAPSPFPPQDPAQRSSTLTSGPFPPPNPTDTIDLQDRSQPSAKDHSASQLRDDSEPAVGRHQAETLREAADEAADEHTRRPPNARDDAAADRTRLYSDDSSDDDSDSSSSFGDSVGANDDRGVADETPRDKGRMNQQDALAIAQNGGAQDDDSDIDIDGDDLDDDMTGGISSSPSIEDGMCPVRRSKPSPLSPLIPSTSEAETPVPATSTSATAQPPVHEERSCPTNTAPQPNVTPSHHHHRDVLAENEPIGGPSTEYRAFVEAVESGLPLAQPPNHTGHETPTDTTQSEADFLNKRKEVEKGEHSGAVSGLDYDLPIPYDPSASDDDDGSDFSLPDDPAYVDSG